MLKSRKTLAGIVGIVLVGAMVALGFAAWSVKTTLANFVAQSTATPQVTGPGSTTTNTYTEQFLQALATQLGTTIDKLKVAITSAAGTVIDQAVADGKISQSQADQLKQKAQNGNFPGPFFSFGKGGHGFGFGKGGFGFRGDEVGITSFASALGMTESDLMTELQAGKSIADVAAEKNIDLQQVKDKVLADAKAKLDTAVSNQQLTQAQADQSYQKLSSSIDQLLQQKGLMGRKGFGHGFDDDNDDNNGSSNPAASPSATPGSSA